MWTKLTEQKPVSEDPDGDYEWVPTSNFIRQDDWPICNEAPLDAGTQDVILVYLTDKQLKYAKKALLKAIKICEGKCG